MSYLVLARKWRPTGFDEVVGQEHVTRTLSNSIRMQRVAHAFLFTGARGVGKTSTARILAKALNCEKGPTPEPCGECRACTEIPTGTAIDVLEIDGASNRGIGEIRELREGIKYAPSRDRYKIYIIDEVHMLTSEAFNALLKTLEEPPAHVKFIFATTEPQKIPVTILSRCQRFDFKRVPATVLTARLVEILAAEDVHMDASALHLIARESEGSMRDAMSLLDRVISFAGRDVTGDQIAEILGVADRRWLHDLAEAVLSHDAARALEIINDVHQYGFDIQHFAAELARFLRDITVIRTSGVGERLTDLSQSEYESIQRLGNLRGPDDLLAMFRVALKAAEEVAHSRFPKLALEMAVIRMAGLRPLRPLDELLSRLEELERKLPDGFMVPAGSVQGPTPRAQAPADGSPRGAAAPAPMPQGRPALRLVPTPGEEEQPEEALRPPVPTAPPVETPAPPAPPTAPMAAPRADREPVPAPVLTPVPAPVAPAPAAPSLPAPGDGAATSAQLPTPPAAVETPDAPAIAPARIRAFEAWLVETDPPLSGEIAQARLTVDAGTLEVGFKNDLFLARYQEGSPAWIRLRGCVERFFGEGARLRVRPIDRSVETTYERRERERLARLEQRRASAEHHPTVATILEAFEGRVRDIRIPQSVQDLDVPDLSDDSDNT